MLFLVLLLAALGGVALAVFLTVRGLRAVVRRSERSRPGGWLRAVTLLAGAGAAAIYAWGLLHVGFAVMQAEDGGAGSFPIEPCREAGSQVASRVDGYAVSYLPLRFECRLSDGGTYVTSSVPGYVNPVVAALGLITATSGILGSTTARRAQPPVA